MNFYTKKNKCIIDEIKRKSFHCLSLLPTFAYSVFAKNVMICMFVALAAFAFFIDLLRLYFPNFNKMLIVFKIDSLLREHERNKISAFTYTMLGMLICVFFSTKEIFYLAANIMIFSDTAAAIIGKTLGKKQLFKGKTIAGTIAFFLTSLLVVFLVYLSFEQTINFLIAGIITSFFATIVELYSKNMYVNDNLAIMIAVMLSMKLML